MLWLDFWLVRFLGFVLRISHSPTFATFLAWSPGPWLSHGTASWMEITTRLLESGCPGLVFQKKATRCLSTSTSPLASQMNSTACHSTGLKRWRVATSLTIIRHYVTQCLVRGDSFQTSQNSGVKFFIRLATNRSSSMVWVTMTERSESLP